MNINTAEYKVNVLLTEHGLYNWTFKFDRSITRFGCCNYTKRQISLSKSLTEANNEETVMDTILHEIAHALCSHKDGHNYKWQQTAKSIGCCGDRCYDSETVVQPIAPKLIGTCPCCEKKTFRYRALKAGCVISCGRCSPDFNKKYILTWTKN